MPRRKIVQSEKGQELSNKNALESIKTQNGAKRANNDTRVEGIFCLKQKCSKRTNDRNL